MTDSKITLPESEIPTHFYNIAADLETPLSPPLHPGTRQPIGPDALAPLFPMGLIEQEVSTQKSVPIPDAVRKRYALFRPTPLIELSPISRSRSVCPDGRIIPRAVTALLVMRSSFRRKFSEAEFNESTP